MNFLYGLVIKYTSKFISFTSLIGSMKISFDVEGVFSSSSLLIMLVCILNHFCQFISTCSLGNVSTVVTNHELENFVFVNTCFWKAVVLYNVDEHLVCCKFTFWSMLPVNTISLLMLFKYLLWTWLHSSYRIVPLYMKILLVFIFNCWNKVVTLL